MPGIGMKAPKRYTASSASVNMSRLRRSGTLKMFATASKNFITPSPQSPAVQSLARPRSPRPSRPRLESFRCADFENTCALHRDLAFQLARAQNLEAVLQFVDDAQFEQLLPGSNVSPSSASRRPTFTIAYSLLENIGESALGQAAVQRHLAAFKSAHARVARDGLGALGSAARILAAPGAHALARCAASCAFARRAVSIG